MIQFILATALTFVSTQAFAATTQKFCGVRAGSAGFASLDDRKGNAVIILASPGQEPVLLDQADDLVGPDGHGETGTQNGTRYCVVAQLDAQGNPVKIVKAYRAL